MDAVITGLVAAIIPSLIVALVMLWLNKKIGDKAEEDKKARERQIKAEELTMELTSASASLSLACAVALRRGETNGEVETAVAEYNSAKKAYYGFINKTYIEYRIEEAEK